MTSTSAGITAARAAVTLRRPFPVVSTRSRAAPMAHSHSAPVPPVPVTPSSPIMLISRWAWAVVEGADRFYRPAWATFR